MNGQPMLFVVLKTDQRVQLYGDFKVTMNQLLIERIKNLFPRHRISLQHWQLGRNSQGWVYSRPTSNSRYLDSLKYSTPIEAVTHLPIYPSG